MKGIKIIFKKHGENAGQCYRKDKAAVWLRSVIDCGGKKTLGVFNSLSTLPPSDTCILKV